MNPFGELTESSQAAAKPGWRSVAFPYALALALLAAGVITRLLLEGFLGDRVIFLFLVPAVLVASAIGGLWPGLALAALGSIAGLAFLARYGVIVGNEIDAAAYAALGVAIALCGDGLLRSRRRADEMTRQLAAREAFLNSVLSTVPDAMIVIDGKGIIRSFSAAAERLFGWTLSEVDGQNVRLLMPYPHRGAHNGYLERYARTGERRIIGAPRLVNAERRDGSTFPAKLNIGEIALGGTRYYIGFVTDLSERHEADRRLKTLQSELIHIARLSAMGEMATTLAHELNQPLTAITNFISAGRRLLALEKPDSAAIEMLGKAADQALRAGETVRRLRDFTSRGESERTIENLAKLLDEAAALALVAAKEKSVRVLFDIDPAVDSVLVDKVQIQQVVLNLVRNALEAMEGSDRRELKIAAISEADAMVAVSVADSGPGISSEMADRLFQPFATTKGAQGMGVGLSICRTIIEAHGGRIWAEPNPDGGAIFRFTIPQMADELDD